MHSLNASTSLLTAKRAQPDQARSSPRFTGAPAREHQHGSTTGGSRPGAARQQVEHGSAVGARTGDGLGFGCGRSFFLDKEKNKSEPFFLTYRWHWWVI
jgi:hypothetical protein